MVRNYLAVPLKQIAIGCAALACLAFSPAAAETVSGVYRGFLAFDYKGAEIREAMMISFNADGTVIMGAEEGHDEPVDSDTGLITKNDLESANLGPWRSAGADALEFGSQQYRAGSGFCGLINKHGEGLLPTCSFILTARSGKGGSLRS